MHSSGWLLLAIGAAAASGLMLGMWVVALRLDNASHVAHPRHLRAAPPHGARPGVGALEETFATLSSGPIAVERVILRS